MTMRAVRAQLRQRDVEDVAADVVEVDVDALRAVLAQRWRARRRPCSRWRRRSRARRRRSGTCRRRRRCRRRGSPGSWRSGPTTGPTAPAAAETTTRLARLGRADVEQAEVGGHARHAERRRASAAAAPAPDRSWSTPWPAPTAYACTPVMPVTKSPTASAGIVRTPTTRPTPSARMTSPMPHRRHVRLGVVHPAAHRRIERQVLHLDEHLPRSRLGDGRADEFEVAALDRADGPRGKLPLAVLNHGVSSIATEWVTAPARANS